MEKVTFMETPVGTIGIAADDSAVTRIFFASEMPQGDFKKGGNAITEEAVRQLKEYFEGKRRVFDLPLTPSGTSFQRKVWEELQGVPYGKTVTYADIAAKAGNPKACRAVGGANNRNPIAIVIPCHRVVGANGSLTGYAGGMDIKEYLLKLENKDS